MPGSGPILFLQYTNPAAYPPLEHSSRILADRGWRITFLGTGSMGEADAFRFPKHPNVTVRLWPFRSPGIRQKLQFFAFTAWALARARRDKAAWIYASDLYACPAAWLAAVLMGCRVIYHEHDTPAAAPKQASSFQRVVLRMRALLSRRASASVLPNPVRAKLFQESLQPVGPVFCVLNCPSREEVAEGTQARDGETVVFYHGSLNAARLPFTLLTAIAALDISVHLRFAGYSTTGHREFVSAFLAEAARLGIADRVQYLGAPATRHALLALCRQATVGAAFMPAETDDVNMRTMWGASNKPFDYLASGLPVLVSDLPEWHELFVAPGYGRSCNPADAASIANALRWFVDHRAESRQMAERGRQRILRDWNYETQFAPVLERIEAAQCA
jgi:glycosyltransferase involved in cell wall biosynthesis